MIKYITRRLAALIPVLLGVTLIVFTLLYFTPGDPALVMLGDEATPEAIEQVHEQAGVGKRSLSGSDYFNYVVGSASRDMACPTS